MCKNTRLETDLLGKLNIPEKAYYGIHTFRAIQNFQISDRTINQMPEFIRGIVMVKKAAAMANQELNTISKKQAIIIIQACEKILKEKQYMDQFPIDVFQGGAGTSLNMNVNEVLTNIGLELMGHKKGEYQYLDPNEQLNKSQSTNDVYPTGLRIAIYNLIKKLIKSVSLLEKGFKKKSEEFKDIIKMGRTQLQDAVPMTVGQEFHAFSTLLDEEIKNLNKNNSLLLEVNLGATAIGTEINTPKNYKKIILKKLKEVTGLPCKSSKDLIEATSDCGAYITIHSGIKRLAIKLSKICNDLRLLSSGPRAGFKEINLPELQAGSSIMPAKVNPVIPEVVNQVCFKVIGNDTCVTMAAEAGQLQLNAMEPVIAQTIFESISLINNSCISLLRKCILGITVNKKICENNVLNSIGIITYLNPYIGHHNGNIIGKICAKTGENVKQVILRKKLLTKKQLDKILSIENFKNSKKK